MMNTIIELPEYRKRSNKLFGDLIQGTGGIRKLRWANDGEGKSGGVRVIYYYHNPNYPLFLLTLFGKSEKANISHAERNLLAKLVNTLITTYGDRND